MRVAGSAEEPVLVAGLPVAESVLGRTESEPEFGQPPGTEPALALELEPALGPELELELEPAPAPAGVVVAEAEAAAAGVVGTEVVAVAAATVVAATSELELVLAAPAGLAPESVLELAPGPEPVPASAVG